MEELDLLCVIIANLTPREWQLLGWCSSPGMDDHLREAWAAGAVGTLQSSSEVGSQPGSATFSFAQTEHRPAPGLLPSSPGMTSSDFLESRMSSCYS